MAFYHQLTTQKSWEILQKIKKEYDFILIGGWAVYLYTKGLKSKDIDMICDYEELEKFRQKYDLSKNQKLKKYEIKQGGIDIDIYLPYFSKIGIPVEKIKKNSIKQSGFIVPKIEILTILKQYAFNQRKGSVKGEKDKIDIISLLQQNFDFDFYLKFLKEQKKQNLIDDLKEILKTTIEIPEINLNQHQFSRVKKSILKKI